MTIIILLYCTIYNIIKILLQCAGHLEVSAVDAGD